MTSIEFLYETLDDFVVKEEPEDGKSLASTVEDWRCGEIVLDCVNNFKLICAVCLAQFNEMYSFGTHIRAKHLPFRPKHEVNKAKENFHAFLPTSQYENSRTASTNGKDQDEEIATNTKVRRPSQDTEMIDVTIRTGVESVIELLENSNESSDDEKPLSRMRTRKAESNVHNTITCKTQQRRNSKEDINEKPIDTEALSDSNGVSGDQKRVTVVKDNKSQQPKFKEACVFCCRIYRNKKTYMAHLKKAHRDQVNHNHASKNGDAKLEQGFLIMPSSLTCKYCDQKFESVAVFTDHIATHTGRRRFVCPYCQKAFSSTYSRNSHVNTHTGERPYKCTHCPKAFADGMNLDTHIRMHLRIMKYSCDYCDKRFVQSTEKVLHERTHTGEKPYQCEECGRRFNSHVKLTEHGRRHKNIKNYKCTVCNKAFYSSGLLKDHMPTHTNERPFHCDVCGQSFPRRKSLRAHQQLHSGEKKYICDTCGKAFAQCAGLYSHKKSHGTPLFSFDKLI